MDKYSEIREMTEDDFINYFAVVILSKNTDKKLAMKSTIVSYFNGENCLNICLQLREKLDKHVTYSGIVVISPNSEDKFNINPEILNTKINIYSNEAIDIAREDFKNKNIEEYEVIRCVLTSYSISNDSENYINAWNIEFNSVDNKTFGYIISVEDGRILEYK